MGQRTNKKGRIGLNCDIVIPKLLHIDEPGAPLLLPHSEIYQKGLMWIGGDLEPQAANVGNITKYLVD